MRAGEKERHPRPDAAEHRGSVRGTHAVVVMARAPQAGKVKTRLCPPLTREQAACLYECLLQDSLHHLGSTAQWDLWIAYTRGSRDYFEANVGPVYSLLRQRGNSLGTRMHTLFRDLFDLRYESVILVGSDIPGITLAAIEQAFRLLETGACDVALGPSDDGGYYLAGLKEPRGALFQHITWSTADVLEQTLERAADVGLRVSMVQSTYDVDVGTDLERLWADLKDSRALQQHIPQTYQWLGAYHAEPFRYPLP